MDFKVQRNSLHLTQQPKDRLEDSLCEFIYNFLRGRMSKKQEKWTIFGEVIWILWIFSPRRNSIASPWSPCSGTTSSSSMSTRKSSSPTSTPFPGSEITDSAVDLRRSWSYYAIFVFFLWYCPGLLILCATDTSNDSGGKERRTRDNRSELSQTRS